MVTGLAGIGLTAILPIVAAVVSILSRYAENPREKYFEDISRLQEDRWGDVCNEIAPAVCEAYGFLRDESERSAEELDDETKTTVALTETLDGPEDFGNFGEQIERYRSPSKIYKQCRKSRDYAFFASIIALLMGLGGVVVVWRRGVTWWYVLFIVISIVTLAISVLLFSLHIWRRSQLDGMCESLDFN